MGDVDAFKPLPSLSKDDKLPPPPGYHPESQSDLPPPPPLKLLHVDLGSPLGSLDSPSLSHGLDSPSTPISPNNPSSDQRHKKTNPLNDLIDTEKNYVDNLTGIIRKVAAAWSRSNLPPPELDTMFRSIEGVYKANRSLLMKLKEIGKNPSSPKALGDLLMRWIDDLEKPYTTYCTKYSQGFDSWDPVQSNAKLSQILSGFSSTNPPLGPGANWTLDSLFLLPKGRLHYYRKLYSRLLRSTIPGKSDHRLLVGALDKLDGLLDTLERRGLYQVGADSSRQSTAVTLGEDVVVLDPHMNRDSTMPNPGPSEPVKPSQSASARSSDPNLSSANSSIRGSSGSRDERFSGETATTSISRESSATMSMPISDLERRLSTRRTLDIFSMTPKVVRLQISPPQLVYTREMRCSIDVHISIIPRSTGIEVVHQHGHIFILSDLFLVCERMSTEDRSQEGPDGPDMWLLYPPLAGKVLRVSEVPGVDNTLHVAIMRKETLVIRTDSPQSRDRLLKDFLDCIDFANSVGPVSKQLPPPVPPLNGNFSNSQPRSQASPPRNSASSLSPPVSRATSPQIRSPLSFIGDQSMHQGGSFGPGQIVGQSIQPGQVIQPQPVQAVPGQVMRSTSIQSNYSQVSVSPGQVMRTPSSASSYNTPPPQMFSSQGPLPGPPSAFHQPPQLNPMPPNLMRPGMYGPGQGPVPSRLPSEHPPAQNTIRKSPSTPSMRSHYEQYSPPRQAMPPMPPMPPQPNQPFNNYIHQNASNGHLPPPNSQPLLPSSHFNSRTLEPTFADPSPPGSPVEESNPLPSGPVTSTVSAQMKCKVFLKQQHAQWKSLGAAKLKLYRQDPTNVKQLVVEADSKDKAVLISTIVLTDGVERVGKTGVAIELSDKGARTGIVYMIQLRGESAAGGLFESLLAGSDRSARS